MTHPTQPPATASREPVRLGDLLPEVLDVIAGRHTYHCNLVKRTHYLYRIYAGQALLYVGVSVDPAGRMVKHRLKPWWPDVTEVTVERCSSREAAFDAERQAIVTENPAHNIARPKVAR